MAIIYVVNHPSEPKCYIGQTQNFARRIKEHLRDAKNPRIYRQFWMKSVLDKGLDLKFTIIGEAPNEEINELEKYFISLFRLLKVDLVNLTDGGDGTFGFKQSPETIEKRASKIRGRKMDPKFNYYLHQVVLANREFTEEQRINTSTRMLGNQYRKGLTPANKGKRKLTEEQVIEIKTKMDAGVKIEDLAIEYNYRNFHGLSAIRKGIFFEDNWITEKKANSWRNVDPRKLRKFNKEV